MAKKEKTTNSKLRIIIDYNNKNGVVLGLKGDTDKTMVLSVLAGSLGGFIYEHIEEYSYENAINYVKTKIEGMLNELTKTKAK